jgi:GDP-D-mannose 3', 5'-epimerase
VNIGSDEMVSLNQLADMMIKISAKKLGKNYLDGPMGVRGRNSDNKLIHEKLGWQPTQPRGIGLKKTYAWIEPQAKKA